MDKDVQYGQLNECAKGDRRAASVSGDLTLKPTRLDDGASLPRPSRDELVRLNASEELRLGETSPKVGLAAV